LHSIKVVLPLFLAVCSPLFADQVMLSNGDRLTGTIEKSDDKALLMKTEFAGEVTLQWPAIQEIKSEQLLHSTNDLATAATRVTANTNKGGARYDHDITPRLFGFLNADFFTDALQDLNLRSVLGGGLGFDVIKKPSTTLDLLGGVAYTREN
jgi:hypothetical protein